MPDESPRPQGTALRDRNGVCYAWCASPERAQALLAGVNLPGHRLNAVEPLPPGPAAPDRPPE